MPRITHLTFLQHGQFHLPHLTRFRVCTPFLWIVAGLKSHRVIAVGQGDHTTNHGVQNTIATQKCKGTIHTTQNKAGVTQQLTNRCLCSMNMVPKLHSQKHTKAQRNQLIMLEGSRGQYKHKCYTEMIVSFQSIFLISTAPFSHANTPKMDNVQYKPPVTKPQSHASVTASSD